MYFVTLFETGKVCKTRFMNRHHITLSCTGLRGRGLYWSEFSVLVCVCRKLLLTLVRFQRLVIDGLQTRIVKSFWSSKQEICFVN